MIQTYDDRVRKITQVFVKSDRIETILDIGFNTGDISLIIKDVTNAVKVYGIDVSPTAVESATSKGICVIQLNVDIEDLPFSDNFFDAIYCGEIIEHLHDPDHLLKEIHRTLKEEGLCVIDTPNLASWHNRIALLFGYQPSYTQVSKRYNVGKFFKGKEWKAGSQYPRHWVFTHRSLKELIYTHNFSIKTTLGCVDPNIPFPLNILEKIFSFIPSLSTILIFAFEKS